jgi:hypothetical protein
MTLANLGKFFISGSMCALTPVLALAIEGALDRTLTSIWSLRQDVVTENVSETASFLEVPAFVAFSQETRTLRGRVTDPRGQVLDGAIVQLQNTSTLWIRSYITQSDGLYHFEEVSPSDSFQVTAKYKGVSSRTRKLSKFSSRTSAILDLVVDVWDAKPHASHPVDGHAILKNAGDQVSVQLNVHGLGKFPLGINEIINSLLFNGFGMCRG